MDDLLLNVCGVTKRFGGLVALNNVTFEVRKGEILGLMGPNGAGKTTLLNVIAGEYAPDGGSLTFKGQDITGIPPHKASHLGIARTYQIPQPFVSLTVRENLQVPALFCRTCREKRPVLDDEEILDLVGLKEKKDSLAGDLTTLLLKKLELGRALACNPELLLLDEVAAGTTEAEIPQILATVREISRLGITTIIIEHVMRVLVNVAHRIVVLDKGMKIAQGTPAEVMNDCQVMAAYFGA